MKIEIVENNVVLVNLSNENFEIKCYNCVIRYRCINDIHLKNNQIKVYVLIYIYIHIYIYIYIHIYIITS